jgi:hypothetical protein
MSTLVGACVTVRVSHNPCPVKGQATTCVAPLHNWLCLVTGSSCRVTNLTLTASVAQLCTYSATFCTQLLPCAPLFWALNKWLEEWTVCPICSEFDV